MDERVVWSDEGRWMKGLMKVLSVGLAILKEWGMIGLLKGYIWECLGSRLVGQLRKRWIDLVNEYLKKRGLTLGKQNKWCMIGMNSGGL